MIKQFCDVCETEITDKNYMGCLQVDVADHVYTVKPPDAIAIDHHLCKYCFIDAFNKKHDDRPEYCFA